jgi:hypothetical protein
MVNAASCYRYQIVVMHRIETWFVRREGKQQVSGRINRECVLGSSLLLRI